MVNSRLLACYNERFLNQILIRECLHKILLNIMQVLNWLIFSLCHFTNVAMASSHINDRLDSNFKEPATRLSIVQTPEVLSSLGSFAKMWSWAKPSGDTIRGDHLKRILNYDWSASRVYYEKHWLKLTQQPLLTNTF